MEAKMQTYYHKASWGFLVVFAAVVGGWFASSRGTVSAQQAPAYGLTGSGASGLITHFDNSQAKSPLLTIVDPQTRVMAVYRIDPTTGEITLRGVRNFQFDLQMDEFNGVSPTPREIRSLLQRR